MPTTARKVGYFKLTVPDKPGTGYRALAALRDSGVNLLAFHAFPTGRSTSQLDFVPVDERVFLDAATKAKLKIGKRKDVLLVEGEDRPGAIADVLQKLADIKTNVVAIDAVRSGMGYGALIWVRPKDVEKAARALGAS